MSKLCSATVESYLNRYGWTFHSAPSNRWQTGWEGEHRSYPLHIELTDTWLSLKVAPLIQLGVDWDSWPELSRMLLELNDDAKLVKLGIDQYGEISLSLQFFSASVPYEDFSDALGVIGHYSEKIYEEISQWLAEIGYFVTFENEYLA